MRTYGANVTPSPSNTTEVGRKILAEFPDTTGSLGCAISEAVEVATSTPGYRYVLGSVLNQVLLHQSVIGLETQAALKKLGVKPDIIVLRCDEPLEDSIFRKIAMFCNVKPDCVIENITLPSLYEAPIDPPDIHIGPQVEARMAQGLGHGQIGIVQLHILAHQANGHGLVPGVDFMEHGVPLCQIDLGGIDIQLPAHNAGEILLFQHDGGLVQAGPA